MTGATTNGCIGSSAPNLPDGHGEQLASLQDDVDTALSLLHHDPPRVQLEDMKALLARVRDFLRFKPLNARPLSSLPEELIDRILSFCDRGTLKSARVVCRALSRMATPRLFGTVHIALIQDVLENFLEIANHPELSQYVKHLVFHGQIPRAFRSQKDWERYIDLRPYPDIGLPLGLTHDDNPFPPGSAAARTWSKTPKHNKNPTELREHYKNYKAVCHTVSDVMRWLHAQNNGRRPDVAANRCNPMRHVCADFHKAIAKLPNLETTALTCHNFNDDEHPFWKAMQRNILMTPSQWKRYYPPDNSPICYDQPDYHMEGVVQLSMLLKALGDARGKNKLRSLNIATERDPFWIQEHLWDPADLWDQDFVEDLPRNAAYLGLFHSMSETFAPLTSLEMDVQYQLGVNHDLIANRTSEFLHRATNLERLKLCFMEDNWEGREEDQERCDLLARLHDISWPRLKELRIETITTASAFLAFLRRVAPSLRALHLYHVSLVHGSALWEDVIAQLPQLLTLDDVSLDSLWDSKPKAASASATDADSTASDDFGRYLLEDAWDSDLEDDQVRALHKFITRETESMPSLDANEFYASWSGRDDDSSMIWSDVE
ncbi:hypothetical protein GTA08_BOTSDO04490 [Neofusicoccum parvum]|nr:hypothetical protein GTA08_BOTSDO04490 [Neofusicoccum parvum]